MNNVKQLPIEHLYRCPKCGIPFHARLHRSWFVKKFMPNKPIRRFFCGNCIKAHYVRVNAEHLN